MLSHDAAYILLKSISILLTHFHDLLLGITNVNCCNIFLHLEFTSCIAVHIAVYISSE